MEEETSGIRATYHLTPRSVWNDQAAGPHYRPEAFETDGFIHCTDGEEQLLSVANAFYLGDPREQIVLVIDVARIVADVRCEDPERIYPHIYGPLNVDAVIALRAIVRDLGGAYLRVGENLDV
ncbi:MAG: DUF952 domain-containing protein [Thermomicrobiales bacterium]